MGQVEWGSIMFFMLICFLVFSLMFFSTRMQMREIEKDLRKCRLFKYVDWSNSYVLEPVGFWVNHEAEYVEVIVTDLKERRQWKEKRLMKDVINKISSYEYVWMQPHEIDQYKQEKEDGIYRFI